MGFTKDNTEKGKTDSRTLIFSHRNAKKRAYRAVSYEFEDVISQIDNVDLMAPGLDLSHNILQKILLKLSFKAFEGIQPVYPCQRIQLDRDYELFFVWLSHAWDISSLRQIDGWKDRCRIKVCWFEEIWVSGLDEVKDILQALSDFDYIFLSCHGSIGPVQEVVGRPCLYMPHAVDAVRFCPYPSNPPRVVDFYSVGRNSIPIHDALLEMTENGQLVYIYEQFGRTPILTACDHRGRLANTGKRSRYYTVYPGKFDERDTTGGQIEFGSRYFDGAATGAVMIGQEPDADFYRELFYWPDAVIQIPHEPQAIRDVMAQLESQPDRVAKIRKDNVIHALLNHDWLYRWKLILDTVGLEPLPAFHDRENQLKRLIKMAEGS